MERELCGFCCMRSTTYTTERERWLLLLPTQNTLAVALPGAWEGLIEEYNILAAESIFVILHLKITNKSANPDWRVGHLGGLTSPFPLLTPSLESARGGLTTAGTAVP